MQRNILFSHWLVHGDIRHLEKVAELESNLVHVHGDIRHLEMLKEQIRLERYVHGDIRHLENNQ